MWLLNNNSKVGHIVYMRSNVIFDDLSPHLRLVGEAKHVQKIVQRNRISVDVLSWTITRMCTDPKDSRLQILTLAAKDYRHNDPKVDLRVSAPIVLTLLQVPKGAWAPDFAATQPPCALGHAWYSPLYVLQAAP
jgi:hypothetical protein